MKTFILFFALTFANGGEITAEFDEPILADNIVQCENIGEELALPIRKDIVEHKALFTDIIPYCKEAKDVSHND